MEHFRVGYPFFEILFKSVSLGQFQMGRNSDRVMKVGGLLLLHLSSFLLLAASAAQAAAISGRVVGPDGKGVANARVYALLISSPAPGRQIEAVTDSNGLFALKDVRAGTHEIHAYAPELGYPDNMFAVFQTAPVPVVKISGQESVQGVLVKLGPRPGTLSGVVIDKLNRKILPSARIKFSWQNAPEHYVQSNIKLDGTFEFSLPERPINVEVTCAGYSAWRLGPIVIPSGQAKSITVEMTK